jgi:UPF0716 protein FxsA
MLPVLILLFIIVPLAELYVIIQVGQWIGVLPTIALLLVDSIAGSLLMRSQGRSAWRRFTAALQGGRVPAREVIDGALIILGGAFLLTPGFLTDIIGAVLLLPPSRALVRRLAARRVQHRMTASMSGRRAAPRGRAYDYDGTATDSEPPRLRARPGSPPPRA